MKIEIEVDENVIVKGVKIKRIGRTKWGEMILLPEGYLRKADETDIGDINIILKPCHPDIGKEGLVWDGDGRYHEMTLVNFVIDDERPFKSDILQYPNFITLEALEAAKSKAVADAG